MLRRIIIAICLVVVVVLTYLSIAVPESESQSIKLLTESENQLQRLAEPMSQLSRLFEQGLLNAEQAEISAVFVNEIEYVGPIEADVASSRNATEFKIAHTQFEISRSAPQRTPAITIWQSAWNRLRLPQSETSPQPIRGSQFGVLSAEFINRSTFEMKTKFEGTLVSDRFPIGIKAHQLLTWTNDNDSWKISKWIQQDFEVVSLVSAASHASNGQELKTLFLDVTDQAILDPETLSRLTSSSHQELIVDIANTESYNLPGVSPKYQLYNDWESAFQYPAVSVVDVDQDGWDDLFVTDRWQPAQLLRNRGDGTFEDITESSGLKVDDLGCCALFADFDNDGDSDVFVGRSLEPSLYFENVDGKFKLDETIVDRYMRFVVSGSVVDINNDGLLDLYLNTYGFSTDESVWTSKVFRPQDSYEMEDRVKNSHWFLNRGGAPNIVLMNRNGRLERVEVDENLAQWHNTYQSAWTDFDADGDLDLYVCNDFGPDDFLINETARGSFDLKFRKGVKEAFPDGTMGFGMGASVGDFNNDGELDLYVSNMYSKAGNRIVNQLDDVNSDIAVAAKGNFLYQKTAGRFSQVAGLAADAQHVSKVGWSFGGQFADFNNDGHLDLYVPSGYYTPSKEIQSSGDL